MKTITVASGFLLFAAALQGQQYVISTIAGGGPPSNPTDALSLRVGAPQTVATDTAGNFYFLSLNCVFKVDQNGVMTRVAGNSRAGYSGDGGPASSAQLAGALAVAVDAAGNLFIADTNNYRIRRVSTSGIITTIAGNGVNGYLGDGGPAVSAQLSNPTGVAVDGAGNVFFSDTTYNLFPATNNRIRMISPNGIITTVAGNGSPGASGDGGPATLPNSPARRAWQSTPRATSSSPIPRTTASARLLRTERLQQWPATARRAFRAITEPPRQPSFSSE